MVKLSAVTKLSRGFLYQVEAGDGRLSNAALGVVAKALGTSERYLSGETDDPGPIAVEERQLSTDEHEVLLVYRSLKPTDRRTARRLLNGLAAATDEPAAGLRAAERPDSYEAAPGVRRKKKPSRPVPRLAKVFNINQVPTRIAKIVGTVAARSEPSWSFDSRDSCELLQVPEEIWFDGCQVVRARGDSLRDVGISDGDLLVCRPQKMGHRRGDIVIARHRENGMLVKIFGGQLRGVITLRSASDDAEPITGTLDDIEICGVVTAVYREG